VNHYCTYFDRGFLIQGLALWRSLAASDSGAFLWVLALDNFTADTLNRLNEPSLRVVSLAQLELGDPALLAAKASRTRVEYYFTLSPCWPRWVLMQNPDLDRLTYLDADLFFFADPTPIFAAMDAARASILITAHRFPSWLDHYEQHGRFNVGVLSFRNDDNGRTCLDTWRTQCLAWCHDRVEAGKYADQGYLDQWPVLLGRALLVLDDPGVNLAPWNWSRYELTSVAPPMVDGRAAIVFHFARFRPKSSLRWWQSGQLDYGVMPQRWRDALCTPYWRALSGAREELQRIDRTIDFVYRPTRLGRDALRSLPLALAFNGTWLRLGDRFFNLRFGLGRWSGRVLAKLRRIVRM
jgi:hypothetical protein